MASRKFELEIDLKSNKAEKDLKKFNKTLGETNKKTKESKQSTDSAKGGFAGFTSSIGPATKAIAGIGAAVTAGVLAFNALDNAIRESAAQARELSNLARTAGVTTTQFQSMAFAAQKFGFDAGKVADVIKDFDDKLGDFTATGAGPFKDVLALIGKQSGLTAESLSKMSGQEGISAVTDALSAANINGKEQAFVLESIAGDLATVIPLFENEGAAIKKANEALKNANALLSQMEVTQLKEYADSVQLVDKQWDVFWAKIQLSYKPAMDGLNKVISDFLFLANKPSARDTAFDKLETDAERVKFLREEIEKLNKAFDKQESRNEVLPISERDEIGANDSLIDIGSQLSAAKAQLAKVQSDISAEEKQNNADINAGIAARVRLTEAFAEQYFGILADQDKMSLSLKDFNTELARTAFIDGKIAGLGAKYRPEQINDLKRAYGDFYDQQQLLLQGEKDTAQAKRDSDAAEKAKLATAKKADDLAKARVKTFEKTRDSLKRELALLNATNDAERTKLQLQFQAQDLKLEPDEANEIAQIQAQIDARQKYLDLLEKEKDAVQDLAEAMGRWAGGSKDAIKQVYAQLLKLLILKVTGGSGGAFTSGFLSGFGSGGINGYAEGGNFKSGETFMVGERGPEIITASAPGSVIPNHQLGGGGGISITPQLVINGGVNGVDELSVMFGDFSNEIANQTQHLIKAQLGPRGVFA